MLYVFCHFLLYYFILWFYCCKPNCPSGTIKKIQTDVYANSDQAVCSTFQNDRDDQFYTWDIIWKWWLDVWKQFISLFKFSYGENGQWLGLRVMVRQRWLRNYWFQIGVGKGCVPLDDNVKWYTCKHHKTPQLCNAVNLIGPLTWFHKVINCVCVGVRVSEWVCVCVGVWVYVSSGE